MDKKSTQEDFWQAEDYRTALRVKADERRRLVSSFTFHSLAKACHVDKAYLSRVFKGSADLSQDQLFLAAKSLALEGLERDFLFELHSYCRSAVNERKKELKASIASIRNRALQTKHHLLTGKIERSDSGALTPYFLDPDSQLVHVFLTIDRYRANPKEIASVLGLTQERLNGILDLLRRIGVIEVTNDGLRVMRSGFHLPEEAESFPAYRLLMRQKALCRAQTLGPREGYFFSVIFSADELQERAMRARFLDLLKASEKDVMSARAKRVYQMSFDLFSWTNEV